MLQPACYATGMALGLVPTVASVAASPFIGIALKSNKIALNTFIKNCLPTQALLWSASSFAFINYVHDRHGNHLFNHRDPNKQPTLFGALWRIGVVFVISTFCAPTVSKMFSKYGSYEPISHSASAALSLTGLLYPTVIAIKEFQD